MKYNDKYDLYIDDDLVIYYLDKKNDKLMQKSICKTRSGYLQVCTKIGKKSVHRIIWESFKGEISEGMEIDHINAIRDDNRLENLRLVTHKENCNNPLFIEAKKGNTNAKGNTNTKGKPRSEFGRKFFEHYGITYYQNPKLYNKEHCWYHYNNKCSWE